jgi:hypothetical protein
MRNVAFNGVRPLASDPRAKTESRQTEGHLDWRVNVNR